MNSVQITGKVLHIERYTFKSGQKMTSFYLSVKVASERSSNKKILVPCRTRISSGINEGEEITVKGALAYDGIWNLCVVVKELITFDFFT